MLTFQSSPGQSTRNSAGLRGAALPHSWNLQSALVSAGPTVEQTPTQHGLDGSGRLTWTQPRAAPPVLFRVSCTHNVTVTPFASLLRPDDFREPRTLLPREVQLRACLQLPWVAVSLARLSPTPSLTSPSC